MLNIKKGATMIGYFKRLNLKLKELRKRAIDKQIPFNLDKEWVQLKLNNGYCEATGLKFDYSKRPFINPYYPSIDRVDSTKGYTKDNCQMVCHMYNTAKCEFSEEVFAKWAKAYVKVYKKVLDERL